MLNAIHQVWTGKDLKWRSSRFHKKMIHAEIYGSSTSSYLPQGLYNIFAFLDIFSWFVIVVDVFYRNMLQMILTILIHNVILERRKGKNLFKCSWPCWKSHCLKVNAFPLATTTETKWLQKLAFTSQWRNFGPLFAWMVCLRSQHNISVGFKSNLWLGYSKIFILFVWVIRCRFSDFVA